MATIITAKNYRYIKVRYYASEKTMRQKDWRENIESRKEHQSAAKNYHKFFDALISQFSGHNISYFLENYMTGYVASAQEELHEKTGVCIMCQEGWYVYCIPKTDLGNQIYDWIIENCICTIKPILKTRGTYTNPGVQTWAREMYKFMLPITKKMFDEAEIDTTWKEDFQKSIDNEELDDRIFEQTLQSIEK